MSTDLRGLLRDLADSVPYTGDDIALADRSYVAGRRRRRLRHVEITSAAAVVVLIALFGSLFLGSAPLAAQYGSSGGTRVSGHPTHIGHQVLVSTLPPRPGPAAGLMRRSDLVWELLSPTGHRWSIPSPGPGIQFRPILSSDGRMLAYPDSHGNFVVRDLVSGTSTLFAGFSPDANLLDGGYSIDYNLPGYFSPNDDELALPGGGDAGGKGIVVLTLHSHQLRAWTQSYYIGDFLAGWLDNRRLALVDRTTSPALLDVRDARGNKIRATRLGGTTPENGGGFEGWDELTTDHATVDVVAGQTAEFDWLISRYDLRDGRLLRTFSLRQPAMNCLRVDGDEVAASTWTGDKIDSVRATTPDGATRNLTTATPSLDPQCIELAQAAAAGTPRSPLLLDRVTDLIVTRWQWCVAGLFGLGVAAAVLRRRRSA